MPTPESQERKTQTERPLARFTIEFGEGTDSDSWIVALSGLEGCAVAIDGVDYYVLGVAREGHGATARCEALDAGRRPAARVRNGYREAEVVAVPLTPGMTIRYL